MWINDFPTEPDGKNSLKFIEPLDANAPPDARPHCCYIDHVVFYKQPYEANERGNYAEWDRVQTRWNLLGQRWTDEDLGWRSLAPFVKHDGEVYELATGRVVWRDGLWFVEWIGRRV